MATLDGNPIFLSFLDRIKADEPELWVTISRSVAESYPETNCGVTVGANLKSGDPITPVPVA